MLLLLCGLLLFPGRAGAQQVTVRGKVTDASNGEGIPGANVVVRGTTTGTITNVDGDFTLSVPSPNATLVVTFIGYRLAWKRGQPWFDQGFHLPTATAIDRKLVVGAAMFGVGWGLAGYCPGPALATVALGNTEVWWFVPAMLAGGWLQRWQAQRSA